MALVASSLHRFLIGEIDCVGGLRNATIRCGCICVASDSSGALGPFTPVDPIYLREVFITHRSASKSAEENKRVIIEAEERYVSRIPPVKMEFKHSIE